MLGEWLCAGNAFVANAGNDSLIPAGMVSRLHTTEG
jgi:hypothetical protein